MTNFSKVHSFVLLCYQPKGNSGNVWDFLFVSVSITDFTETCSQKTSVDCVTQLEVQMAGEKPWDLLMPNLINAGCSFLGLPGWPCPAHDFPRDPSRCWVESSSLYELSFEPKHCCFLTELGNNRLHILVSKRFEFDIHVCSGCSFLEKHFMTFINILCR